VSVLRFLLREERVGRMYALQGHEMGPDGLRLDVMDLREIWRYEDRRLPTVKASPSQ
jgi:hypothetical protein